MKINLIQKLNPEILDKALEDYSYKTSQFPKYIIMNEETFKHLRIVSCKYPMDLNYNLHEEKYWLYDNYPIAFCNMLAYGEIEIV